MSNILVTDFREIKVFLDDIFWELEVINRLRDALENFKNKKGYVVEGKAICFLSDLDDYDLTRLLMPLDDRHIQIDVESATSSANEDSEAYLSFDEFYSYLKQKIDEVILSNPKEKDELLELLSEVKKGLGV